MLQRRLIPALLLDRNQHLVKSTCLQDRIYIGDPQNACYLFSGFHADEIFLLDIDSTRDGYLPNVDLVSKIAEFASVPLAFGGGIHTLNQIDSILGVGVERVVLSSVLRDNPNFLRQAVSSFGSSSVSVILNHSTYIDKTPMGSFGLPLSTNDLHPLQQLAHFCENEGVGELIIHDLSREGTRIGFDVDLFHYISRSLSIPLIALGGCHSHEDVRDLFSTTSVAGASIFSSFFFDPATHQ